MANPRLPGISENEQALLYAKLNEYNRGRASFKEEGVYLVVLPPTGETKLFPLASILPCPKNSRFFTYMICHRILTSLSEWPVRCSITRNAALFLWDYNEKRMQSNGDDLIFFGKYRGHFLHEIPKNRPFLFKLDSL